MKGILAGVATGVGIDLAIRVLEAFFDQRLNPVGWWILFIAFGLVTWRMYGRRLMT